MSDKPRYIRMGEPFVPVPSRQVTGFTREDVEALFMPSESAPCTDESHRHFTCGLCKGRFCSDPDFTEEQRIAEMESYFGAVPDEARVSVCESCFQKIHPARN